MAQEHIDQLEALRKKIVENRRSDMRNEEGYERVSLDLEARMIRYQQLLVAVDAAIEDEKRLTPSNPRVTVL